MAFTSVRNIAIVLGLFFLGHYVEGCRPKCEEGKGIAKSLRPFFTECLTRKLGNVKVKWEQIVNYVVWDDLWYDATELFFCKGKNETCWMDNVKYLIKDTSYPYVYLKHCIKEYAGWIPEDPSHKCESLENPVYRPRIYQKFESILGCPLSAKSYVTCLSSAALAHTAIIILKPGEKLIKPSYRMTQLSKFLTNQRADCRLTQIGNSYIRTCIENKKSLNKTESVIRSKRALNLKNLFNSSVGRIDFRLTGGGVARILPSKPLKVKASNAPKCLPPKLAMVMKARTVLSAVVSRCNSEENKRKTRRVSTSFIIAVPDKKEPGQVGKCKSTQKWSKWFNIGKPSNPSGDFEYFSRIRRANRRAVCVRPTAIQAVLAKNNKAYTTSNEDVRISPTFGLSCHNYKQDDRKCEDYKVRFCCKKI